MKRKIEDVHAAWQKALAAPEYAIKMAQNPFDWLLINISLWSFLLVIASWYFWLYWISHSHFTRACPLVRPFATRSIQINDYLFEIKIYCCCCCGLRVQRFMLLSFLWSESVELNLNKNDNDSISFFIYYSILYLFFDGIVSQSVSKEAKNIDY